MYGTIDRAQAWNAESVSRDRSGRCARRLRASARSASRSGSDSTDIAQPIDSASLASCLGDTCHGCSSYGGTSARSSKKALSINSGVTPGMRAPSTRVIVNGL